VQPVESELSAGHKWRFHKAHACVFDSSKVCQVNLFEKCIESILSSTFLLRLECRKKQHFKSFWRERKNTITHGMGFKNNDNTIQNVIGSETVFYFANQASDAMYVIA
jgi:hypothetical protein